MPKTIQPEPKLEKLETEATVEEKAKLVVPKGAAQDPFHKLAFYNPRMSFNRSISSLALSACGELLEGFHKIKAVDGLCATGARGVRYALENAFVNKVYFVDANPYATQLLRKNITANKLSRKAVVVEGELNEFFGTQEKHSFDFVEVDPFGTPVPFLQPAVQAVRDGGVISVTATDLAALSGKEQATCIRNYASKPMRCGFTHDNALRIMMEKVSRTAAKDGRQAKPLFSFYQGHAVKTLMLLEKAPKTNKTKKANDSRVSKTLNTANASNTGFISLCRNCLEHAYGQNKVEKCPACGTKMDYAGPLWLGRLCDDQFLAKMIELLPKKGFSQPNQNQIEKTLFALAAENTLPPFFFELHELASKIVRRPPKTADSVEALQKKGFTASTTHFSTTGIRTNATVKQIAETFPKSL